MSIKGKWQQLAKELDFEFKEGIDALIESPHLGKIAQDVFPGKTRDIEQAKILLKTDFVRTMLSKIFLGMATGTYRDFEFLLYRSASSSSISGTRHYDVNVVLFFNKPYHWGMEITTVDFFSKLGKTLLPKAYVKIPHSPLNPLVRIKAKGEDRIRTLLSYDKLQQQLVELFSYSKNFKVSDYGIRFKESGEILAKERVMGLMDMMVNAAETFY